MIPATSKDYIRTIIIAYCIVCVVSSDQRTNIQCSVVTTSRMIWAPLDFARRPCHQQCTAKHPGGTAQCNSLPDSSTGCKNISLDLRRKLQYIQFRKDLSNKYAARNAMAYGDQRKCCPLARAICNSRHVDALFCAGDAAAYFRLHTRYTRLFDIASVYKKKGWVATNIGMTVW